MRRRHFLFAPCLAEQFGLAEQFEFFEASLPYQYKLTMRITHKK